MYKLLKQILEELKEINKKLDARTPSFHEYGDSGESNISLRGKSIKKPF